jgi:hypothetical protein
VKHQHAALPLTRPALGDAGQADLHGDNRQRAWRVVAAVGTIAGIAALCVIVTVPLAKMLITGFQKTPRH